MSQKPSAWNMGFFCSQEHCGCDFERASRFILIKKENVAMVDVKGTCLKVHREACAQKA